jgi:hypothetical protein
MNWKGFERSIFGLSSHCPVIFVDDLTETNQDSVPNEIRIEDLAKVLIVDARTTS